MTQAQEDLAVRNELLDARRWQAVCERDKNWDGAFVFAVCTTGIYCRPSCRSRRAKRENLSFYETPEQAKSAGYRACKRCKPDQADHSPHVEVIVETCRDIQAAEEEPDLATLAASAGFSPGHFQRIFKAHVGLSPKRYAMAVRKQRLRNGLSASENVAHAIYDAGYASASRAYADNAMPGLPHRRYKKGAEGETIHYANTMTSLGSILVAATDRGICLVEFAEKEDSLGLLETHFPRGHLEETVGNLTDWIEKVVARIDLPQKAQRNTARIPLDIRGTAFQEKVWQALTEIPPGETVSYAQLARSLGQPKATRAVASACASNHLAVMVPCHRAIRGSGDLAGYKWGIERKRALLEREAENK